METEFLKANIFESNCQVLMSLREMFKVNDEMMYKFAYEASKVLRSAGLCDEDDFVTSYEVLATYGVLMSGFAFGYNTLESNPLKRLRLYTSSMSTLQYLANKRILVGKKDSIHVELQDIEKKLYDGNRIIRTIKDGYKVACVRLDFEIQSNREVRCTATIPRSAIDLNNVILIPYETFVTAQSMIEDLAKQKILRITMGDKVRDVTKNESIIASIYGEDRALVLLNQFNDLRVNRFYLPVAGASIYSAGVTNIQLEDIDKVEILQSIADLNLTELNINYQIVKGYLCDIVNKMTLKNMDKIFKEYGLENRGWTKAEVATVCCTMVNQLSNKEAYDLMQRYPKELKAEGFSSAKSKYGDKYILIEIPNNVKELEDMLKKGVFKIRSIRRNGKYNEAVVTNNAKELRSVLGENYEAIYESDGVKLRRILFILEKDKKADPQELLRSYGFENYADSVTTYEDAMNSIRKWIYDIDENKTVVNQPHLAKARCLTVTPDTRYEFYKNFDLRTITEIVCLKVID